MNKNTLSWLLIAKFTVIASIGLLAISVNNIEASPSVFPYGVTIDNPEKTYKGFTLYAPLGGKTGEGESNKVYLINMKGDIVHTWNVNYRPGAYGYLLEDGRLLYAGKTKESDKLRPQGGGGLIQEIDWQSNVLWEYRNNHLHHDFEKLPNGNLLVLIWEPMKPKNVEGLLGDMQNLGPDRELRSDAILEIDYKTKEVVWEWHAEDELDFEKYPFDFQTIDEDWLHINALEYLANGNPFNEHPYLLISLRNHDTILAIDKDTREITWEWGSGLLSEQHDPTILSNGNLLVFDNKGGDKGSSRVIEVDPKSKEILWEYSGEGLLGSQFNSSIISGAQRLPNGNTLIAEGLTGRIFEVTRGGAKELFEFGESKYANEIVWEYINPHISPSLIGNSIYRAYRYGPNDINWPQKMPNPYSKTSNAFSIIKSLPNHKEKLVISILIILAATSAVLNVYLWRKRRI